MLKITNCLCGFFSVHVKEKSYLQPLWEINDTVCFNVLNLHSRLCFCDESLQMRSLPINQNLSVSLRMARGRGRSWTWFYSHWSKLCTYPRWKAPSQVTSELSFSIGLEMYCNNSPVGIYGKCRHSWPL